MLEEWNNGGIVVCLRQDEVWLENWNIGILGHWWVPAARVFCWIYGKLEYWGQPKNLWEEWL